MAGTVVDARTRALSSRAPWAERSDGRGSRRRIIAQGDVAAIAAATRNMTAPTGASHVDAVEPIDTEDDDAEFDERAHWGRRRNGTKQSKSKRTQVEDDITQPKIDMFCVVKKSASKDSVVTRSIATGRPPESAKTVQTGMVALDVQRVEVKHSRTDRVPVISLNNAMASGERVAVAVPKCSQDDLAASDQAAMAVASVLIGRHAAPINGHKKQSGHPKRQALVKTDSMVRAARAAGQKLRTSSDEDAEAFATPPTITGSTKLRDNRATSDGEPNRKVNASSRKRKLDLQTKNNVTVTDTLPAAIRPHTVFFLNEREKKQVIEIEAVSSFKEQLRQQRERDRAFFGNREANNSFFKARAAEKKIIVIDADQDAIELEDEQQAIRTSSQSKSRWMKELELFPPRPHTMAKISLDEATAEVNFANRKLMLPEVVAIDGDDVDTVDVALREEVRYRLHQTDAHLVSSDAFWLMESVSVQEGSINLLDDKLSRAQLVEKVAEQYNIDEDYLHKIVEALDDAQSKRQKKERNLSFVDRYAPTRIDGMIGNAEQLHFLASWLSAWKHRGADRDRRNRFQAELFVFEDDNSDEDDDSELCKLFILEGDIGSGKSAAVYACAEELGYEVIEINASQNRGGKSVVEIVGEATQSTRVLHIGSPSDNTSKAKKSSKKRRSHSGGSATTKPSHLSLVLFEDVDLLFESDKGFLSTLGSIAKHSKCPIVVTCSERPDGFPASPQALPRRLTRPSMNHFIAWITLVAYFERIPLTHALGARLAEIYECDIRRSLHFLQMYQHRIGSSSRRALTWEPPSPTNKTVPASLVVVNDDSLVPAWSCYGARSFDIMTSNLLPQLRGSLCDRSADELSRGEKASAVSRLDDLATVLDATSFTDVWESDWGTEAMTVEEDNFFEQERVDALAMDVRMLSLATFTSKTAARTVLHIEPCALSVCMDRAVTCAKAADQRVRKSTRLGALKNRLDLPTEIKGCEVVGQGFSLDYIPMVARILQNSAPLQESRRRVSRRNNYLREMLSDMAIIDDIQEFHAYAAAPTDNDETVPLSVSTPLQLRH